MNDIEEVVDREPLRSRFALYHGIYLQKRRARRSRRSCCFYKITLVFSKIVTSHLCWHTLMQTHFSANQSARSILVILYLDLKIHPVTPSQPNERVKHIICHKIRFYMLISRSYSVLIFYNSDLLLCHVHCFNIRHTTIKLYSELENSFVKDLLTSSNPLVSWNKHHCSNSNFFVAVLIFTFISWQHWLISSNKRQLVLQLVSIIIVIVLPPRLKKKKSSRARKWKLPRVIGFRAKIPAAILCFYSPPSASLTCWQKSRITPLLPIDFSTTVPPPPRNRGQRPIQCMCTVYPSGTYLHLLHSRGSINKHTLNKEWRPWLHISELYANKITTSFWTL